MPKHKHFIAITDGFNPELFSQLKKDDTFVLPEKSKLTQEEIFEILPNLEAIVIRSATKPNKDFLDRAKKLKYIIRAGEGTDNIDKAYCQEKGIKVSNTPGANNNSAAEHAIALMLTILRKTAWANSSMLQGQWNKSAFMGNELTKKRIGIIGFGRIGQLVAKRLSGFEPEILFYDPSIKASPFSYAKKVNELEELFKSSDIITIHAPLLQETQGLIDKKYLSLMKEDAIIVNTARGKIVNEDDLYNILNEKKIKGAGFDVFASEPLPQDSPLKKLDNLILTPHLGGSTHEAQFRVGEMVIHQLKEFFLKNNLLNEVRA